MKSKDQVDICIIGSGAGGSVAAYALAMAGFSVAVLEAGPRFDPAHYPLNQKDWETRSSPFEVPPKDANKHLYTHGGTQNLDPSYSHLQSWTNKLGPLNSSTTRMPPHIHRVKGVGGTTLHYQGEAHRFSPHGFQPQSHYEYGEDWPISYKDLEPYYEKIEQWLRVAGDPQNTFKAPRGPFPMAPHKLSCASQRVKKGFDKLGLHLHPNSLAILSQPMEDRPPCNYCNGCTLGCMMRAKSSMDVSLIPKAEATGRVTLIPNAHAHRITLNKKGNANGVLYFDHEKSEHRLKAQVVVVAAGALESPRLLLNSSSKEFPEGLANRQDVVGRYCMETIFQSSMALFSEPIHSYKGLQIDSRAWDFNAPSPGQTFQGGVVLGVSAGIFLGPLAYAGLVASGWGKLHKDVMRTSFGNALNIFAVGEHLPHPDNRITLDPEVLDFYGVAVAKVTTTLRKNEWEMLTFMTQQTKTIAEAAQAKEIIGQESAFDMSSITHMGGTCRMGQDPRRSVVNKFCQTHDIPNVFVMDNSCFVTQGGGDSPSLTIQALALRASDYIIDQAKKGILT